MIILCKHSGYQVGGRLTGARLYLGDKGSDTPPPDPRLIEAQIKSLGAQDAALQRILDSSEEMQPLIRQQMEQGLEAARVASDNAASDRAYSIERRDKLTGLQDMQVKEAKEFDAEAVGSERAATAMADVGSQAALARQAMTRNLDRRGVDPTSGNAMAAQTAANLSEVSAKVGAGNAAKEAARNEGRALVDRATNTMAGYPSMGMATTNQGLQTGIAGLGVAGQGLQTMNWGNTTAINGASAMGSNATSAYNSQANFYSQQQQAAASDPTWSTIGTVAGMAMMMSSRKLKKNIRGLKPGEGLDMIEGIPVSRWKYRDDVGIDDRREHVGPMAQDVQAVAGDEVAPRGEQIDVINMNGITMAAVKDLANEVRGIKRALFSGGIKQREAVAA